jgi:hypothetical protein
MKMLIFALLAKARHVTESIKDSRPGGGQAYDRSLVWTVLISLTMYKLQHYLLYKFGLQI